MWTQHKHATYLPPTLAGGRRTRNNQQQYQWTLRAFCGHVLLVFRERSRARWRSVRHYIACVCDRFLFCSRLRWSNVSARNTRDMRSSPRASAAYTYLFVMLCALATVLDLCTGSVCMCECFCVLTREPHMLGHSGCWCVYLCATVHTHRT